MGMLLISALVSLFEMSMTGKKMSSSVELSQFKLDMLEIRKFLSQKLGWAIYVPH